ncbi:MAG: 30S ribosomal protein S6 [Verrucomicrobia bacterium]|nr:30S ribosomal protein S6 [bacterium]NDA10389.1 30S ribosomal protein S6 [Verrucomicrobiota bacterium]NDA26667.1 30S ribosomal protein S6 [Verrucomicrobiota bacterium]NDD57077.1 30S ribosomal protein S6 [Verrucomicrobiota bacterium]NDD82322.1 30S ribosomal protein S6 [Verrucomicrobiota bacterium]
MKTYDLLVILDLAGKEESLPETLGIVENEIKSVGGRVVRTQKMERKKFEYVAGPLESGFYVNFTCELPPLEIPKLRGKLELCSPVYRHLLVVAGEEPKKESAKAAAAV